MKWVVPCTIRKRVYAIARRLLWNGDPRPSLMYRRGRDIVSIGNDEILYFRWFNDYFEKDGTLCPANIMLPDQ